MKNHLHICIVAWKINWLLSLLKKKKKKIIPYKFLIPLWECIRSLTLVGRPKKGPRSVVSAETVSMACMATLISLETTASFNVIVRERLEGAAALKTIVLFNWSIMFLQLWVGLLPLPPLFLSVPGSMLPLKFLGVEVLSPSCSLLFFKFSRICSWNWHWLGGKSSKGSSSRMSKMESLTIFSLDCSKLLKLGAATASVWTEGWVSRRLSFCSALSSFTRRELSSRILS